MPINITMPALSPTMEEGNLAKWLVKEGDKVSSGDILCEIETDKATMEVESVDEGTVAKLVVAAGTEGVKVNALIAILAADGEDVAAAASGGGAAPAAKAEPAKMDVAPAKTEGCASDRCSGSGCSTGPGVVRHADLLVAARPPSGQGCGDRYLRRCRHRPARPRHQEGRGNRRCRWWRKGCSGSRRSTRSRCRRPGTACQGRVRRSCSEELRRRLLRTRAA